MTMQLLAMHGWAGDSRGWEAFAAAARQRGWQWSAGDRGYGPTTARAAAWNDGGGRRVLIAHSLGPHLLPAALLEQVEAVVLLASFGRFVPPGAAGRSLRTALAGMAAALEAPRSSAPEGTRAEETAGGETAAEAMLRTFLARATAPQPLSQLPTTVVDQPLSEASRRRLITDLQLLGRTTQLPPALPAACPCLIVEAGSDRIVAAETRALLRQERPDASVIHYPEAGHCLLGTPVVRDVMTWIGQL